MRPYRRPRPRAARAVSRAGCTSAGTGTPPTIRSRSSPAQAGLVALVDGCCDTGLRQKTSAGISSTPTRRAAGRGRTAKRTGAPSVVRRRWRRCARWPTRASTPGGPSSRSTRRWTTFVAIYQPLFGVVQPAARAARKALTDFLQRQGIDPTPRLPRLLAARPVGGARAGRAGARLRAGDRSGRPGRRARRLPRSLRRRVALLGRGRADLARDPRSRWIAGCARAADGPRRADRPTPRLTAAESTPP